MVRVRDRIGLVRVSTGQMSAMAVIGVGQVSGADVRGECPAGRTVCSMNSSTTSHVETRVRRWPFWRGCRHSAQCCFVIGHECCARVILVQCFDTGYE